MAGGGGETELNLVPYMDIMMNLILFMLVVTMYIVQLREAPVLAPAYSSGPKAGQSDTDKPKPFLTVAISSKSIAILGSTDDFPAEELVMTGNEYPYKQLQASLRKHRDEKVLYEVAPNLVLTAEARVPYKVVVQTMDACRSDKQGTLFPGVTLGIAVTGR